MRAKPAKANRAVPINKPTGTGMAALEPEFQPTKLEGPEL